MSVSLDSKNGNVGQSVSNGSWAAIIALARSYDPKTCSDWNGCHDGQEWTPSELTAMADRLESTARLVPILRDLAADGGVTIS